MFLVALWSKMSCPICLDPYKDPVVLPCGHSLCKGSCANMIVKKGRLTCPTCRAVHVTPNGIRSLPKNYALEELMEENDKLEITCPLHLEERARLFCTQCYVPVCDKCCCGQPGSGVTSCHHSGHQVISLEHMHTYVQGLLSTVRRYLEFHIQQYTQQIEEMSPFQHIPFHMEESGRLKERLIAHSDLLSKCKTIADMCSQQMLWPKLRELRLILKTLDDLHGADQQRKQWSSKPHDEPSPPKIIMDDCVVTAKSVSVVWDVNSTENIKHYTVYFETAIFTNGLCSDQSSVVVRDFAYNRGHVTIPNLQSERRYKVCVTSTNDTGESLPSLYLYCRTSATQSEMCLM